MNTEQIKQERISKLKELKIITSKNKIAGCYSLAFVERKFPEVYDEMTAVIDFKPVTCGMLVYHYVNQMPSKPVCPECKQGKLGFTVYTKGYTQYCSVKCMRNSQKVKDKIKQTCLDKYGVENVAKSDHSKNKAKQTCLDKYGVENSSQSEEVKAKIKQTCLEKYGVEHFFQSDIAKDKIKETCLDRYGVEHFLQSQDLKDKTKAFCLEKYGVEHFFQSDIAKDKIKETCLDRYGVEHSSQSKEAKDKTKQTCLDRYGVENVSQLEDVQNKIKHTSLERYGVDHFLKAETIKEKVKQTCIERYKVEYALQHKDVKDKSKKTCIYKYGVEHPMQDRVILERAISSSYKKKQYILPNDEIIKIQGYEPQYLDWYFMNEYKFEDLGFGVDIPSIKYVFDDKNKVYHPDFYIKSTNTIIEIKSDYTYNLELEQNLAKQKACIDQGYSFKFYIMDQQGKVLETF